MGLLLAVQDTGCLTRTSFSGPRMMVFWTVAKRWGERWDDVRCWDRAGERWDRAESLGERWDDVGRWE